MLPVNIQTAPAPAGASKQLEQLADMVEEIVQVATPMVSSLYSNTSQLQFLKIQMYNNSRNRFFT